MSEFTIFTRSLLGALLVSRVLGSPPIPQEEAPPLEFPDKVEWKAVFEGVEYAALTLAEPRPARAHALRIDLSASGIEVIATPSNGEKEGETDGWRTSTFLEKSRCQAAINGAPFSPVHSREGLPQDVSGLLFQDGVTISPASPRYPVLLFTKERRAQIAARAPRDLSGVAVAVSGFHFVLEKGRVLVKPSEVRHPRTAAGVAEGGRVLLLLVIDGRQRGYSEGASTFEVAEWLRFLGATDGINLDGGGTSTMVLADPEGKAKVVNRPIHAGIPGTERVAACHLGIRARALEERGSVPVDRHSENKRSRGASGEMSIAPAHDGS